MEVLKKTLVLLLLWFGQATYAQNGQALSDAFNISYQLEKEGKYSDAVNTLKAVYVADSYPVNLRLAWLSYLAGQYVESVSYYQKAVKLKPLSIEAHLGLTYPASAMGNWDMVITQYRQILKIDPNNYNANLNLGKLYYARKDYGKAQAWFDVVLNHYPFSYDPVINSAWNYLMMGKQHQARVLFEYALLLNPGDESATKGLSRLQ